MPLDDSSEAASAGRPSTVWELFRQRVLCNPHDIAYREPDRLAGEWRDYRWSEISHHVDQFRGALAVEALQPGDRVAILVPNGIDWVCFDLAAHAAGLVIVGLYPNDSAASNAWILGHSDARLVLVDTAARWQSLEQHHDLFPALQTVWVRDGNDVLQAGPGFARNLADVLGHAPAPPPARLVSPATLATLIYTSGTSGRPKGVMLSHSALLWNAQATAAIVPPRRDDVFLSVLPLAHAFERTVGYYLPMLGGSAVAYARSPQTFREDIATVRPSVILAVPLLYERIAASILTLAADSLLKRGLLRLTAELGWRRFLAAQGRDKAGLAARLLWPLLNRYVVGPALAAFGGRLRIAVSGGAPLDQVTARFLIGLGVPLVEGYGLTETAPVIACNTPEDNVPGSAGRPLQGVEVKLSAEKELLVRSPSLMIGYWKDAVGTARVLDPAGWLATGDVAEFTDGRIFIRGRLRETIVLSIGESVNPNVIESALVRDPLFEQAVVVGNGRPYLAALVVLNAAAWSRFAARQGLDPADPNHPASRALILARIVPLLSDLPRFASVRAVHLMLDPWTIAQGTLTPTFKVKRGPISLLHAGDIEALYAAKR